MTSVSRSLRSLVFAAADWAQLARLFGQSGPRILLYHGVTRERGSGIFNYRHKFVDTNAFRAQIMWLKRTYHILPLQEYMEAWHAGRLPDNALAITFDDGYANNFTDAYPIFKDLGVPATFFITTGFIEGAPLSVDMIEYAIGHTKNPDIFIEIDGVRRHLPTGSRSERISTDLLLRNELKRRSGAGALQLIHEIVSTTACDLRAHLPDSSYRPMTPEHMREMEAHGMTFAPHTTTHSLLARLDSESMRQEIIASRDTLARWCKQPLAIFAYPNGGSRDFTDETIQILKDAGFTYALTTEARTTRKTDEAYRIPRFTMDGASDIHRARLMARGAYTRLARL